MILRQLANIKNEFAIELKQSRIDPVMDPLRDDPRFGDLMNKMNFQRDARQALHN
jgi:hypothetical protein